MRWLRLVPFLAVALILPESTFAGPPRKTGKGTSAKESQEDKQRALCPLGYYLQRDGQRAAALNAYTRCLEAGANIAPERRLEVMGLIQSLSLEVGIVHVRAPDGATIAVDDVEIGTAPLKEPIYVDEGAHEVTATHDGRTETQRIVAAPEARLSVEFRTARAARPPASAEATAAPQKAERLEKADKTDAPESEASTAPGTPSRAGLRIGGFAAATLLAAGSVYFGIQAGDSAAAFDEKKATLGTTRRDLDDLQTGTRENAALALGLGVSALAVATATLLFVKTPRREAEARVVATGRFLGLAGRF